MMTPSPLLPQLTPAWGDLPTPRPGEVWLIGAGPGHPGYLTLTGWQALLGADVIVHDRLGSEEILLRLPSSIERIDVGKMPGGSRTAQEEIHAILEREARAGRRVARLKGGDPFVFGRGSEEMAHLQGCGIPVVVVPGVSSAIAAPGAAGIPVTHRAVARSFVVSTGRDEQGKLPNPAQADTRVFLMGISALPGIVASLREEGVSAETPVAIVSNATTYRQRVLRSTLGTVTAAVEAAGIAPPAVLLCGATATLGLYDQLPGAILAVGSRVPAGLRLRHPGTPVLWRPLERPEALQGDSLAKAIGELQTALASDCLLFHGAASVQYFTALLLMAGYDWRAVRGRVAALGDETSQALARTGIQADLHFARLSVAAEPLAGQRVLLVGVEEESHAAADGWAPPRLAVYRWARENVAPLDWEFIAAVCFSAARQIALLNEVHPTVPKERLRVLCVGGQVAAAARAAGYTHVEELRDQLPR